jgi:hypothetical protein
VTGTLFQACPALAPTGTGKFEIGGGVLNGPENATSQTAQNKGIRHGQHHDDRMLHCNVTQVKRPNGDTI